MIKFIKKIILNRIQMLSEYDDIMVDINYSVTIEEFINAKNRIYDFKFKWNNNYLTSKLKKFLNSKMDDRRNRIRFNGIKKKKKKC